MLLPRSPRTIRIEYESEGFSPSALAEHGLELSVSWDEILWAAMTIGRPNLHHVFQHAEASIHEAMFRLSLVRMALERRAVRGSRLYRTDAYKQLDPTEKGGVSYFLGMTFCKLFSSRLLATPWLLHLDVFGAQIGATVLRGRSRPDLVGQSDSTSLWHGFECKGRASPPNSADKAKAKAQAQRLVSVGGAACELHIGTFTYFKGDKVQFYWGDPREPKGKPIELPSPGGAWREYYAPFMALLRRSSADALPFTKGPEWVKIDGLDIELSIHPALADALWNEDWQAARQQARSVRELLAPEGYELDGLGLRAGESWNQRFRPVEG